MANTMRRGELNARRPIDTVARTYFWTYAFVLMLLAGGITLVGAIPSDNASIAPTNAPAPVTPPSMPN